MFTASEILSIKAAYGSYSTWAIWDFKIENDTEIIYQNFKILHSRWVIIGLNISKPVEVWQNFRGGKNDRKLKIAFNAIPEIRGAYMTDLFKHVKLNAKNILSEVEVSDHVNYFIKEMKAINVTNSTKFIVLGNQTRLHYDNYFEVHFPNNKVFYLNHCAMHGKDEDWVAMAWKRLNIKYLNFNEEKEKY